MLTISSRKLSSTAHITNHTYKKALANRSSAKVFAGGSTGSIVYYIRLDFISGLTLYKIGYTSMSIQQRVNGYYDRKLRRKTLGVGIPCGCTWAIIATLYIGSREAAYTYEQALHTIYNEYRYIGPALLKNGNTELYVRDILYLDVVASHS